MDEFTKSCLALAIIALFILGSPVVAYWLGVSVTRAEAVEVGVGHWESDPRTGWSVWTWNKASEE